MKGMLKLYHGTAARFKKLAPSPSGFYGQGIYLTPDLDMAEEYALEADDGTGTPRVIAATVQLKNPYVFNAPDALLEASNVTLARMLFEGRPVSLILAFRGIESRTGLTDQISRELCDRGHDALVITFSDGECEYLLFDADAIVDCTELPVVAPDQAEDIQKEQPA